MASLETKFVSVVANACALINSCALIEAQTAADQETIRQVIHVCNNVQDVSKTWIASKEGL